MKKNMFIWLVVLLVAALLVGCAPSENTETTPTEPTITETEEPTEAPTEEVTEAPTEAPTEAEEEEDIVYEGDASSYYIDVAYADQIDRYYTALSEKWDEGKYLENGMSEVLTAYYAGNPLNNVGFGFQDLDNDGRWELIIGAIEDAEECPAVFEIWTLVDDKPVMLTQTSARNQYMLQFVEEDNMWYVANEGSSGAFGSGYYSLMLIDGKLEVMQGILYDAQADSENPWFMTYDMDGDTSNDDPVDEDTAIAIREINRSHYTAIEYFPYILYK